MSDKLGIVVGTDRHLDWVIKLADAAHAKGKNVEIFFTGFKNRFRTECNYIIPILITFHDNSGSLAVSILFSIFASESE